MVWLTILSFIILFFSFESLYKELRLFTYMIIIVASLPFMSFLKKMLMRGNLIIFLFLALNYLLLIVSLLITNNIDRILPVGAYDFDVFTEGNMIKLVQNEFMLLAVMLIIFKRASYKNRKKYRDLLIAIFDRLKNRVSMRKIYRIALIDSLVLFAIFLISGNILQAPYPSHNVYDLLGGTGFETIFETIKPVFILPLFFVYFMVKSQSNYKINMQTLFFKSLIYLSIFSVILLRGSRGASVGLMILLLIFDFLCDKSNVFKRFTILSLDACFLFLIFFLWQYVRTVAYEEGFLISIINGISIYREQLSLENIFVAGLVLPLLPQSIFHFLYTIDLIEKGVSLNYATFINLIPQQLPSFLDGILWTRPINDNYILMEYFQHGGGFYIFANAYWNGGIVPMILFTAAVSYLLVCIERYCKKIDIFLLAYPIFIVIVPITTFYGIQPFVRGLELGGILLLILSLKKYSSKDAKIGASAKGHTPKRDGV